jgi:3-oxoacyl-[acyl-carrier-protein] synthase-1
MNMKHKHDTTNAISSPAQSASDTAVSVSISDIGLCCQTGSEAFALFGAVAARFTGARPHKGFASPISETSQSLYVQYAPIDNLIEPKLPRERIAMLAETALVAVAGRLPAGLPSGSLLVLTLLPPEDTSRGKNIDKDEFQKRLVSCHPKMTSASFRFVSAGQGGVETLKQVCSELNQGMWERVVFGGVDSLVDMVTLSELVGTGKAMFQGDGEGVIPGEGAAYLVLEKRTSTGAMARLDALCAASEPNHNQAHRKQMTGLTTAIKNVIEYAGTTPDKLDSIVLPFSGMTPDALEWHHVVESVWSRRENISRNFETFHPAATLGATGAATLPLSLALGCARFEFDFPPAEKILVCEAGDGPPRGAVFLKKSH